MKKLMCIGLFLFLLTGCVKGDFGVKINKDGSGVNTITIGVEQDTLEQFSGAEDGTITAPYEDLEAQGYSIKEISENGFVGFQATKKFDDVRNMKVIPDTKKMKEEPLDTSEEKPQESPVDFSVDEGFFTNTYRLEGEVDLDNSLGLGGGMDQLLANQVDLTFTLDLPVKASEHNADEVDGSVLSWQIQPLGVTDIIVEAKAPNLTNIIWTGSGLLVVLAIVILAGRRKKKKNRIKELP
ncbi:hypothetical protein [Halobacillus sp. Marseille-Q1614]|uniref:LppM family (lipo)protein n=1 Tax=Halobacillus sp. Marseille-Q1614 TaxID=2709134 RepID=UPI00156F5564|nr:hypothetical protein [Halobacillus sp. Marseille-Q1614]